MFYIWQAATPYIQHRMRLVASGVTITVWEDYWRVIAPFYFGAMRSAPSMRITSPLSMGFSMTDWTSCAYSAG